MSVINLENRKLQEISFSSNFDHLLSDSEILPQPDKLIFFDREKWKY